MSDTDDTDVLVNIPPHSFLQAVRETESTATLYEKRKDLNKKPKGKQLKILTEQVDKLKLSLEKLENISFSDPSSRDYLGERRYNFFSKDPSINPYDIYSSSDCSAVSYLSITSTINMETRDEESTNEKTTGDKFILNEIDDFLKNIENNTSTSYLDQSTYSTPGFSKSHKVSNRDHSSPEEFVLKPKIITKHSQQILEIENDKNISKSETIGDGYLQGSVPDYGFGMKEIMYGNEEAIAKKPSTYQSSTNMNPNYSTVRDEEDIEMEKKLSKTSLRNENSLSRSSPRRKFNMNNSNNAKISPSKEQNRIEDSFVSMKINEPNVKATKSSVYHSSIPIKYHNETSSTINTLNECKSVSKMHNKNQNMANFDLDYQQQSMPNLIHLWNNPDDESSHEIPDSQKFEEEKIRREHCEQSIQTLQKAVLEQQQKLAIARQVEVSKDETLKKLKDSFALMMNKSAIREGEYLHEANKTSFELKTTMAENDRLKEALKDHKEEIAKLKKTADGCEEKYKALFIEKDEIIHKLQSEIENHNGIVAKKDEFYNELKESNSLVVQLNKQISETVSNMRIGMDKMTDENQKLQENCVDSKKSIEGLQDEIALLKNEKNRLISKLSEERAHMTHVNTQKTKLEATLDEAKSKFKALETDYETLKQESSCRKEEMKTYFQKQVETIVFEKVNEFQRQLNVAESMMEREISSKEKEATMKFVKQLQKVEQQHKTEISILEEKQKEEIKLYRLQLAQSSKKISNLEGALSSHRNRRGQIVAQLHNVMENQWKEALRIITNNPQGDNSSNSQISDPSAYKLGISLHDMKHSKMSYEKVTKECDHEEGSSSHLNSNKFLKCHDDKTSPLTEAEIHNYIKMLLLRAPGIRDILGTNDDNKDCDEDKLKLDEDDYSYPVSEIGRSGKKSHRRSRSKKPWK